MNPKDAAGIPKCPKGLPGVSMPMTATRNAPTQPRGETAETARLGSQSALLVDAAGTAMSHKGRRVASTPILAIQRTSAHRMSIELSVDMWESPETSVRQRDAVGLHFILISRSRGALINQLL